MDSKKHYSWIFHLFVSPIIMLKHIDTFYPKSLQHPLFLYDFPLQLQTLIKYLLYRDWNKFTPHNQMYTISGAISSYCIYNFISHALVFRNINAILDMKTDAIAPHQSNKAQHLCFECFPSHLKTWENGTEHTWTKCEYVRNVVQPCQPVYPTLQPK